MVVAMARDPRVLVIKLADRLHNMRTLRFLPPEKQERKARETLEVLAPLAHRLGMNTVKWELEDLAFATLYPKRYDEIVRLVAERAPSRDTYLAEVIERINADLQGRRHQGATVTGRPKHYYSIYQKMIVRGREFTDIYDLVGIRVLVETERDCYATLGVIHANWQPVPGRFKDYIAMPKFNMYQSLHTTVIGPGGKPVELQIRTHAMHRTAEYGIAAHWKYKEHKNVAGRRAVGRLGRDGLAAPAARLAARGAGARRVPRLAALRPRRAARSTSSRRRATCMALPAGSTPVDFAYAVHTEVGHRCIGARVNGKLVALESTLDNGDTVEIFTSKAENAGPSRDWLSFVKSPRARTKIRQWFAKERREDAIDAGKTRAVEGDAQGRRCRCSGCSAATSCSPSPATCTWPTSPRSTPRSARATSRRSRSCRAGHPARRRRGRGRGHRRDGRCPRTTARPTRPPGAAAATPASWSRASDATCGSSSPAAARRCPATRSSASSPAAAACRCTAAPARTRRRCTQQAERLVDVEWAPSTDSVFVVSIQVEALDRHGLLSDVSRVLSDERVSILSATVSTNRDRVAVSRFTFEMAEAEAPRPPAAGDPHRRGRLRRLPRLRRLTARR